MPLAAELVQTPLDAEFMTQSPSQTVSIYEALAEILSKPTESLTLSNSKSTDRTLFSEAPISSTTTSTTTTTTSTTPVPTTTEAKDDLKVESSTLDGLDNVQSVNTARVHNQEISTEAPETEITTKPDDLTTTLNYTEPPFSTPISLPTTSGDITTYTLNDFQTESTPKEEFSTFTMQTLTTFIDIDLKQNINETDISQTNNLISFDNETNAYNKTEIETTEANLQLDQKQSSLKQEKINSSTTIMALGNNFKKALTTSTVPPDYSPRFSQSNRIPILSFGVLREERKVKPPTKSTKIDLMTNKITRMADEINSYSTPSVYPIYRPEFETTTVKSTFPLTESSSTTELLNESTEVTEMIVTSFTMTLDEVETTTFLSDDETIDSENSTRSFDVSEPSGTSSDFTTVSKNLIEEINELTTVTDSSKVTTERIESNIDANPISNESSNVPNPPLAPAPFKPQLKFPKSLFPKSPSLKPHSSEIKERIVYAILPNNTVIRKIIQERLTTENPYVIYGIFPNKSVIRKFRNGTLVPDDSTTRIEITNIDPRSLINPTSEFHRESSETSLKNSALSATTNLPITDQTKTVFYLLISILNSLARTQKKENFVSVNCLDFIGLQLLLVHTLFDALTAD